MNEAVNVLRADEVKQDITREEALLNAPLKSDEYFKVTKVIQKN
jgi:aspartyl-tRNA(Asn)/glutamyl-tRNA(Gln) amidotransferase subunit C